MQSTPCRHTVYRPVIPLIMPSYRLPLPSLACLLARMFTMQDEAHLVFSTLNSSGLPCMDHTAPFEVLVVDEAAQSVEVSTIIPLRSDTTVFF